MEFKLNKIDIDIRKRMQEERKSDKVHSSKNINIDINDGSKDKEENKYTSEVSTKKHQKRFITIDGIKYRDGQVKVQAEKTEEINVLNSSGRILDAKK